MSATLNNELKEFVFAYPGDLQTPTGGYAYDRRIIRELSALGWSMELISLGAGFPFPDGAVLEKARQLLCRVHPGKPIVVDGLALGVMPDCIAQAALDHPMIALVHHPLALESGLTTEQQTLFRESETKALSHVSHVIANSPSTAQTLTESFGVAPEKIGIVLPGTDPICLPIRRIKKSFSEQDPFHWLSVGSIIPRKGFKILVESLTPLNDFPWRLSIVGDASRDAKTYSELLESIDRLNLKNRIHFHGVIDRKALDSLYRQADGFVLASLFEGYGMAYAEALSYALPVIGSSSGAITQTVPISAGVLLPPGDIPRLTAALRLVMEDPHYRQQLSFGAQEAAKNLPSWANSAKHFASIVESCVD